MALKVYNTLTRQKEEFRPGNSDRVTMYACGPTVYNHPHIGNARFAVVFDVLYRYLKSRYDNVVYARNITDIDDRINRAAYEAGVPIKEIADKYTVAFNSEMDALGLLRPTIEPKATEHIPVMLNMVSRLIESGHAYEAEGHVLFSVESFTEYGSLSKRNRDDMIAGARVEVAPFKKGPMDFVLWKPSDDTQPGWDSPWGRGRPGWHLECSCMIESHLGETIDIHGGGNDLIFPHHENEMAQSTCAHPGVPFVRYWMHNGFVNMNSEKMSKSLGNVLLVRDLLKQAPAEAIRLALISAQYRQPLDWTDGTLTQAQRTLDGFYGTLRRIVHLDIAEVAPPTAFVEALNDDLNTPKAVAELASLSREANSTTDPARLLELKGQLLAAGYLLGLLQQDPEAWFKQSLRQGIDEAAIERLIEARAAARANKDFVRADALRAQLAEMGVIIEDCPTGTTWRVTG